MKANEICGYVTSVPQISKNGNSIYGGSFEIYEIKNGKLISGVNVATGEPASVKFIGHITDGIRSINYSPGVRRWEGYARYHVFDTMKEALDWKYSKVIEAFETIERKAKNLLKKNETKKKQVGFYALEEQYPEIVL